MTQTVQDLKVRIDTLLDKVNSDEGLMPEYRDMATVQLENIRHHCLRGNDDALQIAIQSLKELTKYQKHESESALASFEKVRTPQGIIKCVDLQKEIFELGVVLEGIDSLEAEIHKGSAALFGEERLEAKEILPAISQLDNHVSSNLPPGDYNDRICGHLMKASSAIWEHRYHAASVELGRAALECDLEIDHGKDGRNAVRDILDVKTKLLEMKEALDNPMQAYAKNSSSQGVSKRGPGQ